MDRFRKPLVILALGLIPFWLFIGASSTSTVNGQVVSDFRFNIAGLILGIIGAGMAFGETRLGARGDMARHGLIILGGIICLVQIVHSVGIITVPI